MSIRRISSITLLVAAGCAAFNGAPARAANPSLMAYEQGIDDPAKHSEELQISALGLRVAVVGTIADVTVTAKFSNPGDDVLEGRFTLDLPPGAVVTGYALNVEDTMIEGVLVDPLKARREYEERVRERYRSGRCRGITRQSVLDDDLSNSLGIEPNHPAALFGARSFTTRPRNSSRY